MRYQSERGFGPFPYIMESQVDEVMAEWKEQVLEWLKNLPQDDLAFVINTALLVRFASEEPLFC